MYKVLLIDDELTIRKGLRKIIDWEYYGFQIFADAASVEEGLLLLNRFSPDLVLLDMKLSQLTGIDFAREARSSGWKGKIIILSGYNDFEYARASIQYDIVDYLLKPVSTEKLVDALTNAKLQLSEASCGSFLLEQSVLKTRSYILHGLLTGSFHYSDSLRQSYHLDLSEGPMQLLCITPRLPHRMDFWENTARQLGCYLIADESALFFLIKGKKAIFFIRTVNRCDEECLIFSEVFPNIDALPEQYQNCRQAMEKLFFLRNHENEIRLSEKMEEPQTEQSLEELAEQAQQYINAGETEKLHQLLQSLHGIISHTCSDTSAAILFMMRFYSLTTKLLEKSIPQVMNYLSSAEIFVQKLSPKSLQENLDLLYREFSGLSTYLHSISSQNIIEKIKHYTEENYWKTDLRLESVALVFGYNTAYLGKLFTKETGISFHTYLEQIRLEKAADLLKTKRKIYEIAEECGFSNPEYFTKKFKKQYNMLPTEYQKKWQI